MLQFAKERPGQCPGIEAREDLFLYYLLTKASAHKEINYTLTFLYCVSPAFSSDEANASNIPVTVSLL